MNKKEEKKWMIFWSEFAEEAYEYVEKLPDKKRLLNKAAAILQPYNPILDAGCGTGLLAIDLAKQGKMVYGVDYSKNMLNKAKEKIAMIPEIKNRVFLSQQNVTNLNFKDSYFEAVVSINVLVNVIDPCAAINETYRVLKKKGIYLVSAPFGGIKPDISLLQKVKEDCEREGYDFEKFKLAVEYNKRFFAEGGAIFTPSRKELEEILEKRGFKISLSEEIYYSGNYFITGQKI